MKEPISDLIRRFCGGDRDAFDDIHEIYRRPLWRYLCARADNHQDAEDLFNIVSLKIARKLSDLRDPKKLVSWVIGIAYKCLSHYYRKNTPKPQQAEEAYLSYPDAGITQEERVYHCQVMDCLRRCVDKLPEPQLTYFSLQFFSEIPQVEIAQRFGINLNLLKSRILRSKVNILECLRKHGLELVDDKRRLHAWALTLPSGKKINGHRIHALLDQGVPIHGKSPPDGNRKKEVEL